MTSAPDGTALRRLVCVCVCVFMCVRCYVRVLAHVHACVGDFMCVCSRMCVRLYARVHLKLCAGLCMCIRVLPASQSQSPAIGKSYLRGVIYVE